MLIDTHCHLDFADDREGWVQRAKEAGVGKIINVGTSIEGSKKSVEIAEQYSGYSKRHSRDRVSHKASAVAQSGDLGSGSPIKSGMTKERGFQIYATVGIHPQDGKGDIEKFGPLAKCVDELKRIAKSSSKVVGIGEIGLDYYLVKSDPLRKRSEASKRQVTSDKEKEFQKELFGEQIVLAQELDLPILVHCRNAWDEVFDLLKAKGDMQKAKGLFHSWTGDWEAAKKALDLGFYISFSGIVTFGNAPLVQEVAKKIPLDRMLVETDSPFLSPEPHRGMRNEPKNVIIVGKFIASIRNQPEDLIASQTTANAKRLFGLK